MKRGILTAALALLLLFACAVPGAALTVSAESAVLLCVETGQVLFEKDADTQRPMASTTKIMTALLALEACTPEREITVTPEMVNVEGTSMGLKAGDRVTLRALVYGMLLESGNDAATAAAIALGGSLPAFAAQMNARAAALGMEHTHFVTPSGLDAESHASTARDMAKLACACVRNPEFVSICSAKTARVIFGDPPAAHTLTNHNRLLWRSDAVIGIKTGFTKRSGRCLVSAARKNGVTLVAVTLSAPDDWEDHLALFDYGFAVCKPVALTYDPAQAAVRVFGGVRPAVGVRLTQTPTYVADGGGYACALRLQPYVFAPVAEGQIIGTAIFTAGGREIARVPVAAAEGVARQRAPEKQEAAGWFAVRLQKLKNFFSRGE